MTKLNDYGKAKFKKCSSLSPATNSGAGSLTSFGDVSSDIRIHLVRMSDGK